MMARAAGNARSHGGAGASLGAASFGMLSRPGWCANRDLQIRLAAVESNLPKRMAAYGACTMPAPTSTASVPGAISALLELPATREIN